MARVHEPQRLLTPGTGVDATLVSRMVADPRRIMLVLLVAGLAASITLSQTMVAVLAVWLLRERHRGRVQLAWPLGLPIAAFAGWTLVSALLSSAPADSVRASDSLIWLATLWVVLHAIDDPRRARWFATALFAGMTVVAALSIVQVATCDGDRLFAKAVGLPPVLRSFFGKCHRAHGFYSIYMTLGGVLAMVLALTLPRLVHFRRRAVAAAAWLVGAAGFALTLVRGAWVGFAVAVAFLACTVRRQAVIFVGLLLVAATVLLVPAVRARVLSFADMSDPTARDRVAMLSAGATLVSEHPVVGIGPGQLKRVYPQYAPPDAVRRNTSHVHNTPMQIAVERGLVGLALWVWIFAAFFARLPAIWKRLPVTAVHDRALVAGSAAAIVAFIAGGLFEHNFGDTEVLLVAMSLMALPFVLERGQ